MSDRNIEIVELDRRLANDPDGAELRRLTERLTVGKGRVTMEMGRGVSTDEYARLSLLAQAYDAGIDALPKLWATINEDQTST
ncbi:MAG: EscE/YscE/SsaE family type III secretion system needle protein co-chaperone [Paracoccus sp. (in: a-proteobacteria)]|uniref:EscE/YscE/SsaE family type III secretion system needle protein co-chaperone n=1 Tax=Paracoccus sp. TaxID=267 RepID=UPI0026E04DCB|nr:EscE/YscE/SsaE family type III secretion system needle protein co-chaperone [Paracoccus sp. (in: a-proteobacteria)]MDO5621563.1 EscE/YscE/SsaE family type III secretion system needle protein co-chaperone [Paracoccus sp. (in: a-proteobacteria)]